MSYSRYLGMLFIVSAVSMWFIDVATLQLSRLLTHSFPQFFHVEKSYISPIDGLLTQSSENVSADIYLHSALLIMLFFGFALLLKPAGSLFKTIDMDQTDETEEEVASP